MGEDWMVEKRVKMDFASRELKYYDDNGQKVILPFTCHGVSTLQQANEPRKIVVRLAKTQKLNTSTCKIVTVRVDAEDGTTGIFLPKPTNKRHLMIAPTVDTVNNGRVRAQVLNVEGRREKLPARDALGTWIPVSEDMKLLSLNGELERKRVAQWVSRLRKEDAKPLQNEDKSDIGEMKQKDRDLVIALLRQYTEIVEKKLGCPPKAKINVEHHINTGDAAPIMMRRRRHAVAENELIDKEVDNMLEQGVIELGEGAWGFPVVIVRKKDGSVRFCIDYRALNSVTMKDVYPLPRVDETSEALHGSQRFSSLDLHAGYWQFGVFEPDKPKTAFTTRRGLFQFTGMPFGLCNAPSTFQRLMNCVLRGLAWVCCLVYLDDVVIFTKGFVAQHVVELAVVLERLAEAGLSLKVSKCSFATTRMEYLGHDLTPDGIQPTLRLVKAIVDFPTPADDTQVRRRFVPEFGTKMAPLTCLLRKSTAWVWGAAQEEAFAWDKVWLSQNPVLIYPDYSLPFKLTTNASKTGLGAVLSQDQGKGDQPVAYASKVNSPTVAKYSISELECLAVVWAARLFRPHIYGRHFTIVTDHVALKWLMTTKERAGRLHRWALTLQEYDFDIVYRPGKENSVADALSRGPATVTEGEHDAEEVADDLEIALDREAKDVTRAAVLRVEAAELGVVQFTDADIKEEQRKSIMVQKLRVKGSYRGQRVFTDAEGLVKVDIGDEENRIVLPAVYWALAFKEAHDSIWAGHLRGRHTLDRLQELYWWPRMRESVQQWVAACQDCGSKKTRPKTIIPPLRNVKTGAVGDRWAIDVAGPLPETMNGHRYVIAAVEYNTRYAVATAVKDHTAKDIARFLIDKVVLGFGPTREVMMGGAKEFGSQMTA
ncbi:Retroelement, partial [Phytophthora megakarya]